MNLSGWTLSSFSPRTVPQYSPIWSYSSMVRASLTTSRRLMAAEEPELQWTVRTQGQSSSVCCSSTGLHLRQTHVCHCLTCTSLTQQVTHLSVLLSPASLGLIQLLLLIVFITEVDRKQDVGQVSVTDPSSSALHSDVHHDAADFRDWD